MSKIKELVDSLKGTLTSVKDKLTETFTGQSKTIEDDVKQNADENFDNLQQADFEDSNVDVDIFDEAPKKSKTVVSNSTVKQNGAYGGLSECEELNAYYNFYTTDHESVGTLIFLKSRGAPKGYIENLDNEIILAKEETTLGRKDLLEAPPILPDIDLEKYENVLLEKSNISRRHAMIFNENKSYTIMDLGSANGTYVNGIKIEPQKITPLQDGDLLCFAEDVVFFKFVIA